MSFNENKIKLINDYKNHTNISDYIITNKRIGSGSFSSIFIGFNKHNVNKIYAIKKIYSEKFKIFLKNLKIHLTAQNLAGS